MIRRSRPKQHLRRVRTKTGRQTTVINRGVKKKSLVNKKIERQIINEHHDDLRKTLKSKGKVRIPDVGILSIKIKPARKARMGMNPFTKEKIMLKAKPKSKTVRFRAAKSLKELLN